MHLAKRGLKVVGFEQFGTEQDPSHDRGASHGGTRVIRKAYGEGGAYVPLLERAFARRNATLHDDEHRVSSTCVRRRPALVVDLA